mgnify:CR=1 FL=1
MFRDLNPVPELHLLPEATEKALYVAPYGCELYHIAFIRNNKNKEEDGTLRLSYSAQVSTFLPTQLFQRKALSSVILHSPNVTPGMLAQFFEEKHIPYKVVKLYEGESLQNQHNYCAIVSLGGIIHALPSSPSHPFNQYALIQA